MDKKILVDILNNLQKEIEKKNVRLSLIMLKPITSFSYEKYELFISSPEFDKRNIKNAYMLITNILTKYKPKTTVKLISNINIINSKDPFVKTINYTFDVEKSLVLIQNTWMSQVYITNAYIYLSKRRNILLKKK